MIKFKTRIISNKIDLNENNDNCKYINNNNFVFLLIIVKIIT